MITRLRKNISLVKLRLSVIVFFVAVMTPAVALVYYSYTQLKWEAFYQQRAAATELSQRISAELENWLQLEENRGVADYQFLNVVGDSSANFFQPSPLASYPPVVQIPGTLGYFQVNAQGEFSSPILPENEAQALKYGVSDEQYAARKQLSDILKKVLNDNELARRNQPVGIQVADAEEVDVQESVVQESVAQGSGVQEAEIQEVDSVASSLVESPQSQISQEPGNGLANASRENSTPVSRFSLEREQVGSSEERPASRVAMTTQPSSRPVESDDVALEDRRKIIRDEKPNGIFDNFSSRSTTPPASQQYRRVDELKIENTLEESAENQLQKKQKLKESQSRKVRSPRKEQSILPATSPAVKVDSNRQPEKENITMFESEVDPFEFRLLDSGHLVFYRKVWRDDTRFVQGMILDRDTFLRDVVQRRFRDSNLSVYTDLVVAYRGDVLAIYNELNSSVLPGAYSQAYGELLVESALVQPFSDMSLIFTVQRLQLGLGLKVIALAAIILMLVMGFGTWLMYRLGLRQMQVAQQQQDFVSAVSHELKTPLTSVRMYGELLKEGWATEEKKREYYDYIVDESERLSRLINNVLQLAKMNSKDLNLSLVNTSIEALVDNLRSKLSAQVERAGFTLKIECDDKIRGKMLVVDADGFMQVMINLIDNGIKFSEKSDSREIDICISEAVNDQVVISVRDYGPGITKSNLKKIFDLFYRGESELTRETVGTGIGLALVEQLMKAMYGRVDVVNCDPGAEFRLHFPTVDCE